MPVEEVETLKISVQDGKVCEKVLKIEVGGEDIQKEYEEFYKSVAPKAKIPGFRPGKAPRDVLAMHFHSEAREEVLKHLISHSYREALREKSLAPLGYPEIQEVDFQDNKLSFQARVEIRPKIKLSKVTGLHAQKEKTELKPEEIEEALKRMQESLAQYKVVEDRPAAMADFVIADFICTVEGKQVDQRKDDWFELREDEFLKGFSAHMVGAKPGEEKEFTISFPDNFARKEFAGKPALFKVSVKEIKTKILPALSDEMAKEAGEFKTLDELKEKIQKDLLAGKEKEKEVAFEKALLDELIKQNKVDLPERLVARRLEHLVEDGLENYRRHGFPENKVDEMKKTMETELAAEARRQVHLAFLLDEIAIKENILAAEADFKERYQRISHQARQPLDVVEKYYTDHAEARESLQDQIRNEKTIEFIKKNAKTN